VNQDLVDIGTGFVFGVLCAATVYAVVLLQRKPQIAHAGQIVVISFWPFKVYNIGDVYAVTAFDRVVLTHELVER